MLKKACIRGFSGFAVGVLIGQIVSIIISLSLADGNFYQYIPAFRALFPNEIQTVIAQTVLTGLVGTAFAASSLIFEIDRWGSLKQYIVHFFITAAFWVPVTYLCWMPEDRRGLITCLLSFLTTYVITWLTQYFVTKNDIRKINAIIRAEQNQKEVD